MDALILGIICGLGFGLFSALIMVPMKFDTGREKCEALSRAFIDSFMIGLLVANVTFGLIPWLVD